MKRLAFVFAACATGCPQEPGPPPSCEPVTTEFVVEGIRAQELDWGEPCVPLFVGDMFRWTQHGSCPERLTGKDAPEFISDVAPFCRASLGPVVCSDVEADAQVDPKALITYGNTVDSDLIVEWYQVDDSGEVVECTQHFDVKWVSVTRGVQ